MGTLWTMDATEQLSTLTANIDIKAKESLLINSRSQSQTDDEEPSDSETIVDEQPSSHPPITPFSPINDPPLSKPSEPQVSKSHSHSHHQPIPTGTNLNDEHPDDNEEKSPSLIKHPSNILTSSTQIT